MILSIYSVKDDLTGFQQPTFEINEQVAMRNFAYAINEVKGILSANPNDFSLFKVGEFDTDTGVITCCDPKIIVRADSILRKD